MKEGALLERVKRKYEKMPKDIEGVENELAKIWNKGSNVSQFMFFYSIALMGEKRRLIRERENYVPTKRANGSN